MATLETMVGEARTLLGQATAIYETEGASAEDIEKANKMLREAKMMQDKALNLKEAQALALQLGDEAQPREDKAKKALARDNGFRNPGHFLVEVAKMGNFRYRGPLHKGLLMFRDPEELRAAEAIGQKATPWVHIDPSVITERKVLLEQTGAGGGFLVEVQFIPELLGAVWEKNPIRARAMVVPMRSRMLRFPVIDQTGTVAGQTRMHGGIVASWTEEATEKDETQPGFRQKNLVAHKLVCYTEVGDELLADEAVGLVAFFTGELGFSGAIRWEEESTFLQGTGVGQPTGVLNAGVTIVVPRAVAGTIGVPDIMNMVMAHHGDNPVWHITRSGMAVLLQLNGPAANPSYIFIPNAREGMPATLMGFPIEWTEKLPVLGVQGDILLADWSYYLIGDRQATTIDSTNIFRFRHDITSWRAVHRVEGQPWLSQPFTLADGATTISPFVILGAVAS